MKTRLFLVGSMFLLLSACTTPTPQPEATSTPTTQMETVVQVAETTPVATAEATVAPTGVVKKFTVVGEEYTYDVKEIKVKAGDTVQLTFKNKEGKHDWIVDEFSASTEKIGEGEEETIEFVANKKGTFEYYCSVGEHRKFGMKGNLIVE